MADGDDIMNAKTDSYGSIPVGRLSGASPMEPPTAEAVPFVEAQAVPVAEAVDSDGNDYYSGQKKQLRNALREENDNDLGRPCAQLAMLFCCLATLVILALLFAIAVPSSPLPSSPVTPIVSPPPLPPPSPPPLQPSSAQEPPLAPVQVPPAPIPPQTPPPPPPPPPPPLLPETEESSAVISLNMARPEGQPLMDLIHLVNDEYAHRIVDEIQSVQHDVPGCQVQVLVASNLPTSYSGTPKQFATALFNRWQLASQETNNGILVLFLQDLRHIEVEVGSAIETYMNNAWTTDMLQRRAVPEFRLGNYGFGLYNVVVSVADRLREIQNGNAIAIPSPSGTRASTTTSTSSSSSSSTTHSYESYQYSGLYAFLGIVGCITGCGCCWGCYDNMYPMGQYHKCRGCGRDDGWRHSHDQTIIHPTYSSEGLKRRHCFCGHCEFRDSKDTTISRLTRESETRSSYTSNTYHNSSSDGGGFSSGDAGGGASWGGGSSSGNGGGGASW